MVRSLFNGTDDCVNEKKWFFLIFSVVTVFFPC